MTVSYSDNQQDKVLATHEIRIAHLEKNAEEVTVSVKGLVQASSSQAKSIKILEKVMYGVLTLALAALVKLVIGIG